MGFSGSFSSPFSGTVKILLFSFDIFLQKILPISGIGDKIKFTDLKQHHTTTGFAFDVRLHDIFAVILH